MFFCLQENKLISMWDSLKAFVIANAKIGAGRKRLKLKCLIFWLVLFSGFPALRLTIFSFRSSGSPLHLYLNSWLHVCEE